MRDSHRAEAERLLVRAVQDEARRGGGIDSAALLAHARTQLDRLTAEAAEEYTAYLAALRALEAGRGPLAGRLGKGAVATPALVTAVAAVAAACADAAFGTAVGTAVGAGAVVAVAGAATTVVRATSTHRPAPGPGADPARVEQLRLAWLGALEVRGIRPFLDQQRVVRSATVREARGRASAVSSLRGQDRSAAARRRSLLEQSFGHLPAADGPFAGRRREVSQITQWVHAARASTRTQPTVVVLHGEAGSGRSTLAVRAAHHLRDQFRGACVVDMRGGASEEPTPSSPLSPLSTRDALLHLLNRLGAPREQLLFRDSSSQEQQVRRLTDLYHRHLTGLPVTVVLDDASDAEQVRSLIPERSDSLVLVTARDPLELPDDLAAWVHQLPVEPLDAAGAEELLREAASAGSDEDGDEDGGAGTGAAGGPPSGAGSAGTPYDAQSVDRIAQLCGGLPLALRIAGSSLGQRSADRLATDLGAYGPVPPVERALWLRYTDQDGQGRRLLRRLALAGRASLGASAAAALLATGEQEAQRLLTALAGAGLIDHVRGRRYRLHDVVRGFALARLLDEEEAGDRTAAQERLIRNYSQLADTVIRLVDGNMSTRADLFRTTAGAHGFASPDAALRWLDDESSFITAALRQAEGVDQQAVLGLLGALCDYCLLRGDLYRLGEINELAHAVGQGLLVRSVQWRTGIAARQIGDLDTARTTLTSVVELYREAEQVAGEALALCSLGITLHHQGDLTGAAAKLREALALQEPESLAGDRAWTLHALAAVERDRGGLREALTMLTDALRLHGRSGSVHGEAWTYFQLGQVRLRMDDPARAEEDLRHALDRYARTRDGRGEAWALTQLARTRLVAGEPAEAADGLRGALARHRDNEDARGEAWTLYYLGQALEDAGDGDQAVRELDRARTMFSRMRDVYGLACARHHLGRVTRDQRAARTGNLRNSGFARQLLSDARADFRRAGVAYGEGWTCVELAIVDAGNSRAAQALALCDEATVLFDSYGDERGADWSRFLRCTLLPYASAGGADVGTAVAEQELSDLSAARHVLRDPKLDDCVETLTVMLARGVTLEDGWRAWSLGMVPGRHAQEVMGVGLPHPAA
ncbi:tetratricopeptide repeat protein [Streptomyces sp. NBC_01497]|uniref:tetratricopeptide repeat protein n=1 Tax=Streptomyces sp. NBC_01497 TaxID=2903885 RepID=UPI002E2F6976|nr:tetratricopeptide repeat protein [Streptomyces sp. NBC_01497]